jgi:hypothetical protein
MPRLQEEDYALTDLSCKYQQTYWPGYVTIWWSLMTWYVQPQYIQPNMMLSHGALIIAGSSMATLDLYTKAFFSIPLWYDSFCYNFSQIPPNSWCERLLLHHSTSNPDKGMWPFFSTLDLCYYPGSKSNYLNTKLSCGNMTCCCHAISPTWWHLRLPALLVASSHISCNPDLLLIGQLSSVPAPFPAVKSSFLVLDDIIVYEHRHLWCTPHTTMTAAAPTLT